jgi:hypothetical protein
VLGVLRAAVSGVSVRQLPVAPVTAWHKANLHSTSSRNPAQHSNFKLFINHPRGNHSL